jgi:dihydroxyacetone kinase
MLKYLHGGREAVGGRSGSGSSGDSVAYYKGKCKKQALAAYWDNECTPVNKKRGAARAKEKAKAKAKGTAKAKAKSAGAIKTKGPANPKRFINDEAAIVQESIDGLIWSTPSLGRLDTFPDIKVIFRTDWDKDKVAIVSGGGAGHEPMHGGFVGKGMLTAAVSGETFASPTIDAVLSAMVQVTGPKGCLLVIKKYTGDRLNFTLAAQRARANFGLKVEIVITKDDVATVAERGIAGTLFVHKIAGALAEAGKSLEEVKAAAEAVIASSASMGVSFSSVRRLKPEMIKPKKMEVGLGIHGEPG